MPVSVSEKKIKSKIKSGEKVVIVENIKYPHFEDEKHKKLCKKMNDFYSAVAEKYSYHIHNKMAKRIKINKLKFKLPMSAGMNYTVALCDEKTVSVVLDLSFIRGKEVRTRRFSQMWSVERGDILSVKEIIKTDRRSRKKILQLVLEKARKNSNNSSFGYFEDYILKLSGNFDITNCFFAPNGLCFFVNAGVLSPVKYGASNFVIPLDALNDAVTSEFLEKMRENEHQRADIVNNV